MAIEYDHTIDYNEQMLNYYPEVIKAIREFQVLIETQSDEVKDMHSELTKILQDAYIKTANEKRIAEWEKLLGITPLPQGDDDEETWFSDRRETIAARLYNPEKLNSKTISDVVRIFTGGEAMSYFKDDAIHVLISLPAENKKYKFENVEQELLNKIPAHLTFTVDRRYYQWGEVNSTYETWNDVSNALPTWEEILYLT